MDKEPFEPAAPETWDMLARYLAGESSAEEVARVRAWLAADNARARLIGSMDEMLARLPREADVDVEAALRSVKTRIAEERRPTSWRTNIVRIAAAIVVVLAGSLVWRSAVNRPGNGPVATLKTYSTQPGQTDSIRLADGTEVVLGPGSELAVTARRTARLSGDALFTVTHDGRRPFTVHAGGATIKDIGTVFAVRSNPREAVHVVVRQGAVLLHATGKSDKDGVMLAAGDHGVLETDGRVVAEKDRATDDDFAWTRGELIFEQAPLAHVATELRRWYGIELQVADSSLTNRHVTASFKGEGPEQVLNVIGLALGARIERNGNIAILHAR